MATQAGGVLRVARQASERLAYADYQGGNGAPPLHHLAAAVAHELMTGAEAMLSNPEG
jgi:hypothetical protein